MFTRGFIKEFLKLFEGLLRGTVVIMLKELHELSNTIGFLGLDREGVVLTTILTTEIREIKGSSLRHGNRGIAGTVILKEKGIGMLHVTNPLTLTTTTTTTTTITITTLALINHMDIIGILLEIGGIIHLKHGPMHGKYTVLGIPSGFFLITTNTDTIGIRSGRRYRILSTFNSIGGGGSILGIIHFCWTNDLCCFIFTGGGVDIHYITIT